MNHNQDSLPTRPYGAIADPHEFARNQPDPGWNRPDVPYSPPAPGYNSNSFHPDGPGVFPWQTGKPKAADPPTRISESYLLAYITELRRRHAEEWLQKDDDIKSLQALNQSLAKETLKPETEAVKQPARWPTQPHRGSAA